jgi:hypothetical protein
MTSRSRARVAGGIVALAFACALAVPLPAAADDDGDREVRGTCSRGSEMRLRVREDDGSLRVELRIDTGRRGARWSVILLHERRIAFRGVLRTTRSSGSLRLRRSVRDLYGRDTILVRASGPRRETCRISATV